MNDLEEYTKAALIGLLAQKPWPNRKELVTEARKIAECMMDECKKDLQSKRKGQ